MKTKLYTIIYSVISLLLVNFSLSGAVSSKTKIPSPPKSSPKQDGAKPAKPQTVQKPISVPEKIRLKWFKDLDSALALAGLEFKPVMVLFSSPNCPWCVKFKNNVVNDQDLKILLKNYILAELDVGQNPKQSAIFRIEAVPTVVFLNSIGQLKARLTGFIDKAQLQNVVSSLLNQKIVAQLKKETTELINHVANNDVPANKWPAIIQLMGKSPELREEINGHIYDMEPFPKKELVKLLSAKRLTVRLGALEILEDLTGDDFLYDPWLDKTNSSINEKALIKWQKWAEVKDDKPLRSMYSSLTKERCAQLLRDIVSGNRERSIRAMRMLETGGYRAIAAINEFLKANPDLPEGLKLRIREVKYSIQLPNTSEYNSSALAHRLIFGNLDERIKAITTLKKAGLKSMLILEDLVLDKDPLIREVAIEVLADACRKRAIPLLQKIVIKEKDQEVIFAIIKGLGEIKTKKSAEMLSKFLNKANNEDIIIAALQSITNINARILKDQITPCLDDKRWRVRAAAIDAAYKLNLKSLRGKIETLLDDKDEFVAFKAVSAMAKFSKSKKIDKLEKIFINRPNLRGAVIAAYGSLDKPFPKSFFPIVKKMNDQEVYAVLQGLEDCDHRAVPLVKILAARKNADIACPALAFIAAKGLRTRTDLKYIIDVLKKASKPEIIAISGSINIDNKSAFYYDKLFEEKIEQGQKKYPTILDLFDLFLEKNVKAEDSVKKVKLTDLAKVLQNINKKIKDKDTNIAIALALLKINDFSGIPLIKKEFTNLTVHKKIKMLNIIEDSKKEQLYSLIFKALNDPAPEVRNRAASAAFEIGNPKVIKKCLDIIGANPTKFKFADIAGYRFFRAAQKNENAKFFRKWMLNVLKNSKDREYQITAMMLFGKFGKKADQKLLLPFTESKDQWVRRAAWYALGRKDPGKLSEEQIKKIVEDPSQFVRAVLPGIMKMDDDYNYRWVSYFNEKRNVRSYFHSSRSHRSYYRRYSRDGKPKKPKVAPKLLKGLQVLAGDPSLKVRMMTYFLLLEYHQPFNLNQFVNILSSFPDQDAVSKRISKYLKNNYKTLGKNFKILLPFMTKDQVYNENTFKKIYEHFGVKLKDGDLPDLQTEITTLVKKEKPGNNIATYVDYKGPPITTPADKEKIQYLVYFTKTGCADCARVKKMLRHLEEVFPEIKIERYNIAKVKSMKLNEAYCERFRVPTKIRMVAPAIFCGSGYLIKKAINYDATANLIVESSRVPSKDWYVISEKELKSSEERIVDRGKTIITFWTIVAAGFLDGINPCAFATIIFFLSYVAIARKDPYEVIQVGLAFIIGVFLTYLIVGLAFTKVIEILAEFAFLKNFFNFFMALFVLVIMLLSIYDGIMCLRGKLENISLQLPGFIKERIRGTIRTGTRYHHFIIGAFVIGIIISLLELGCTGQVYIPTIVFMLKTGAEKFRAYYYLLLYNFCFILPLIVIFIMTYFGLKSDHLSKFMQKHTAWVKFGTALLFLLIFIFLILNF